MEEFKESTRRAFKQCRTDIDSLKIENDMLKEKLNSLGSTNSKLQTTISDLNSEMKGIKIALDYIKSFNENSNSQLSVQAIQNQNIQNQSQIQQQVELQPTQTQIPQSQNYQQPQVQPIYRPQQNYQSIPDSQIPSMPVNSYDALIAFKAKSNKREMLKQKLISMIGENGMNLSELKFMFVDHQRFVSKATFYNYLKELEASGTITQERVHGKAHVFVGQTMTDELNSR
jgi:chromosome segregation ATPase